MQYKFILLIVLSLLSGLSCEKPDKKEVDSAEIFDAQTESLEVTKIDSIALPVHHNSIHECFVIFEIFNHGERIILHDDTISLSLFVIGSVSDETLFSRRYLGTMIDAFWPRSRIPMFFNSQESTSIGFLVPNFIDDGIKYRYKLFFKEGLPALEGNFITPAQLK